MNAAMLLVVSKDADKTDTRPDLDRMVRVAAGRRAGLQATVLHASDGRRCPEEHTLGPLALVRCSTGSQYRRIPAPPMPRVRTLAFVVTAVLAIAAGAFAQVHTAVVLDQAEQPLPGATVSLIRGATVVATTVTNAAGAFTFERAQPDDVLEVSLGGFQTVRVRVAGAARIMLMTRDSAIQPSMCSSDIWTRPTRDSFRRSLRPTWWCTKP